MGGVVLVFALGCTAKPPSADSLPISELPMTLAFRYQAQPDSPPPAPAPVLPDESTDESADESEYGDNADLYDYRPRKLLAAGPSGTWAAADPSRLWIGSIPQGSATLVLTDSAIQAIDVDRLGAVWIVEAEGRLLSADIDQAPRERGRIPLDTVHELHVRGERLVALGHASGSRELALSRDGRDWTRYTTSSEGNMPHSLSVGADGLIQLLDGFEAGCGGGYQERSIAQLDLAEVPLNQASAAALALDWVGADWPFDAISDRHVGADGWAFALSYCGDDDDDQQLCAIDRAGKVELLLPFTSDTQYVLQHGHGQTMVLTHEDLWEIVVHPDDPARLQAKRVNDGQAVLGRAHAVDGAGHILLLVEDEDGDRVQIGGAAAWQGLALPAPVEPAPVEPA